MNIVHIITRLILGGAQENTLISCRELSKRGHNVTLITGPATGPEGELFNQTKNAGYKVITIDRLIRPISPLDDAVAFFEILKVLKKLKPDIVHTHSAKAGIVGRFAADRLKPRPKIVHSIHGLAFHSYQSQWLNKFYIVVERAAGAKTDFFISVADAMTSQAIGAGIGRPEQYATAYSAIEEEQFLKVPDEKQIADLRDKYSIGKDSVVLVTIARLFMLKGHDYIIESAKTLAKKYDNVTWLFVGDGNLAEYYEDQVARFGLSDRIKFTGLLPPSEIPLVLHSSDILVHCSLREGLARAIPQAMLCGKPAIAFDLDGSAEVVNESTGRLIKAENTDQLIDACSELIEDKLLREALGRGARESVKKQFAPVTMVDAIERVYKKLLEG